MCKVNLHKKECNLQIKYAIYNGVEEVLYMLNNLSQIRNRMKRDKKNENKKLSHDF